MRAYIVSENISNKTKECQYFIQTLSDAKYPSVCLELFERNRTK